MGILILLICFVIIFWALCRHSDNVEQERIDNERIRNAIIDKQAKEFASNVSHHDCLDSLIQEIAEKIVKKIKYADRYENVKFVHICEQFDFFSTRIEFYVSLVPLCRQFRYADYNMRDLEIHERKGLAIYFGEETAKIIKSNLSGISDVDIEVFTYVNELERCSIDTKKREKCYQCVITYQAKNIHYQDKHDW